MRTRHVSVWSLVALFAWECSFAATPAKIEALFAKASRTPQQPLTFSDGTTTWIDGSVVYRLARSRAVIVRARALALDTDGASDAVRKCDKGDPHTAPLPGHPQGTDANVTPYIVLPGCRLDKNKKCVTVPTYAKLGLQMGDLAAVITGDRIVFAIAADLGPEKKFGEGSVELHRQLGHETIGLRRATPGCAANVSLPSTTYIVVLPNSNSTWLPKDEIARRGEMLWQKLLIAEGLGEPPLRIAPQTP